MPDEIFKIIKDATKNPAKAKALKIIGISKEMLEKNKNI